MPPPPPPGAGPKRRPRQFRARACEFSRADSRLTGISSPQKTQSSVPTQIRRRENNSSPRKLIVATKTIRRHRLLSSAGKNRFGVPYRRRENDSSPRKRIVATKTIRRQPLLSSAGKNRFETNSAPYRPSHLFLAMLDLEMSPSHFFFVYHAAARSLDEKDALAAKFPASKLNDVSSATWRSNFWWDTTNNSISEAAQPTCYCNGLHEVTN